MFHLYIPECLHACRGLVNTESDFMEYMELKYSHCRHETGNLFAVSRTAFSDITCHQWKILCIEPTRHQWKTPSNGIKCNKWNIHVQIPAVSPAMWYMYCAFDILRYIFSTELKDAAKFARMWVLSLLKDLAHFFSCCVQYRAIFDRGI